MRKLETYSQLAMERLKRLDMIDQKMSDGSDVDSLSMYMKNFIEDDQKVIFLEASLVIS